jgi:threonine synthase
MSEQEILELAAILIDEHGTAALTVAERRRDQHVHEQGSVAAATAHLLRKWRRIRTD